VELADCIKILDRYFEQQFGKGSNFYKQAWLPVKRASKLVEAAPSASANSASDAIAILRQAIEGLTCGIVRDQLLIRLDAVSQQRTLP